MLLQVVHLVSQDLSIAGNRKGLAGERSGLFMEQIRIIKEMREADRKRGRSGEFVRCRYAIWENVGGAFSSNKGRDFQTVLTEFVRVAEPDAPDVPMPEKGKWPKFGWLYDEMGRWSVAWRMHDAQFWGVPQRRKRIALVADFGGVTAPFIIFDPQYRRETEGTDADETEPDFGGGSGPEVQIVEQGLSGHSKQSGTPGQGTAEGTEGSVGGAGDSGRSEAGDGRNGDSAAGAISFQERAGKPGGGARESLSRVSGQEPCQRLTTRQCCSVDVYNQTVDGQTSGTVTAATGGTNTSGPKVIESLSLRLDNGSAHPVGGVEVSPTIRQGAGPNGYANVAVASVDCRNGTENENVNVTLQAKANGGQSLNCGIVIREKK